jgi:hypothetical protein
VAYCVHMLQFLALQPQSPEFSAHNFTPQQVKISRLRESWPQAVGLHAHFFESLAAFVRMQCPNAQSDKALFTKSSVLNGIKQ